jgi:hypothetical protein
LKAQVGCETLLASGVQAGTASDCRPPPTKPKSKIDPALWTPAAPEDNTPIKIGTDEEEDAEIAKNLPTLGRFQRSDIYGNPYFRPWSREEGYPGEDKIAVLVHFAKARDETEAQKPKSRYMTFKMLRKHSLIPMREVPIPVKFGADLMFHEEPTLREIRLQAIILNDPDNKPAHPKGHFSAVWRRTHADCTGYDEFMRKLDQNIKPQAREFKLRPVCAGLWAV